MGASKWGGERGDIGKGERERGDRERSTKEGDRETYVCRGSSGGLAKGTRPQR